PYPARGRYRPGGDLRHRRRLDRARADRARRARAAHTRLAERSLGRRLADRDDRRRRGRARRASCPLRRLRRRVADSFAEFAHRSAPWQTGEVRLLGTSGTVTTLASVHLDLPQYDRRAVDGLIVPAAAMREIAGRLSTMSPEERRGLPCIGNERADLVVAGCAILEAILDIWPADRLGVADRGIREGILRSLMAADAEGLEAQAALRRLKQRRA